MLDFTSMTDVDVAMSLYALNKADCDATVLQRERTSAAYLKGRDALHIQRMVRDMHQLRLTNRELAAAKSADQAEARQAAINSADEFHSSNLCPVLNNTFHVEPLHDDMVEFESMQRMIWALT